MQKKRQQNNRRIDLLSVSYHHQIKWYPKRSYADFSLKSVNEVSIKLIAKNDAIAVCFIVLLCQFSWSIVFTYEFPANP